jgi:hypothetical protein
MAGNVLTGNPMTVDTAATLWSSANKYVQLIQWIDDAADIANDDDILLVINGVTITGKIQMTADTIGNLVVWEMAFNPPMRIESFVVTTLDSGLLVIWLA